MYQDTKPMTIYSCFILGAKLTKQKSQRTQSPPQQTPTYLQYPYFVTLIAAGLFEYHRYTEIYIEKGLSLKPDNISLLLIAETFYLNHPKDNMLGIHHPRTD